ncbi:MAG: hypothetical protein WBF93_16490 [Pirellulales bacterium]
MATCLPGGSNAGVMVEGAGWQRWPGRLFVRLTGRLLRSCFRPRGLRFLMTNGRCVVERKPSRFLPFRFTIMASPVFHFG